MDASPLPLVEGLPVIDVLGARIGRVAHADETGLEVELTPRVAQRLGLRELHVAAADIIDADDHEVTLKEEAPLLAHPELRAAIAAEERGE